MKKETEKSIALVLIGIAIGLIISIIIMIGNNEYKSGQIDAINGDIKYELVTQNDSTTKWKLIKK